MRDFFIHFFATFIACQIVFVFYESIVGQFFKTKVTVKVKLIEGGKLPVFKTVGAVCADCCARIPNGIVIEHGQRETIPLGFAMELPEGYELQVRPRSGNSKNGIDIILGTGDWDFTGEYTATICNNSHKPLNISDGERICQVAVRPVPVVRMKVVKELKKTERGANGWGSTGNK